MVSILRKHSRKNNKEVRNQPVSSRLTDDEYNGLVKLCEETGFSTSEAIRLLIQKELEGFNVMTNTERIRENTESLHTNTESFQTSTNVDTYPTIRKQPSTTVNKSKRVGTSNRFITSDWKVDNELPCPICNSWVSAANYARHAKGHNTTTKDIFTEYKEKADQMVTQRKHP